MDAAASPGHRDRLVRTRTPNGSPAWAPPAAPGQHDPPPSTFPSSSLNLKRVRSPGQQGQLQGHAQDEDDVDAEGEPDVPPSVTPAVTASIDQHPPLNDHAPAAAGPAGADAAERNHEEPPSKRPRRAAAQASANATRQLSKQQRGDSSSDEDEDRDDVNAEVDKDIAVKREPAPAPAPPVKEPKPKPERKKPGPRIHKLPKSVLLQQQQQQQHQLPPPSLDLALAPAMPGAGPLATDLAVHNPVAGPSGTTGNGTPVPVAPLAPPPEPIIAHLVPVQSSDGEMPERSAYDKAVDDYVLSLHPIKRNKALMTDSLHDLVLKILISPQNTQLGDPQLRFWVRQRFTLLEQPEGKYVLHDNKKVVLKDALWDTIASAHAESKHGGRDKTYAAVKKGWSYVPKEVVTVFVKSCPTCGGKRATERKSTGPREKKPKESKAEGFPAVPMGANGQDVQAGPSTAVQQQLGTAESGNAVAGPSGSGSNALQSTEEISAALVAALGAANNSHALNNTRASQTGHSGKDGAGFGRNGVELLPQPSRQGPPVQQQQHPGATSAAFLPLPEEAHNGPSPQLPALLGGPGQSHPHAYHPNPLYGYHPHAPHPQSQLPPPQQSHPHVLPFPPAQFAGAQYQPYSAHPSYLPLPPPPPPQQE
ncbi:hypothetical protein Rt10032_c04g2037 [Rhodotorula toruloides]|uniref:Integrase zinc-binding domain-containing protein n=1 Tax=Rhodotorula toruloides TaxID=5286 RepID=A0A511KCC2_RHOTO|nr:hypothetical protein Rt10032_c04g2037 [Rhodotorula toruloides]